MNALFANYFLKERLILGISEEDIINVLLKVVEKILFIPNGARRRPCVVKKFMIKKY